MWPKALSSPLPICRISCRCDRKSREDQSSPEDAYTGDNLYMQECRAIINTLSRCNGNIRLAAQELGIARSALYGKLTRFGIDYAKFRNRYR